MHAGSLVGEPGAWNNVLPRGKPPAPRYEHAVASLGGSMFVVGGNCSAFPFLSLRILTVIMSHDVRGGKHVQSFWRRV